jgi:environmental stress-induced protein Ves
VLCARGSNKTRPLRRSCRPVLLRLFRLRTHLLQRPAYVCESEMQLVRDFRVVPWKNGKGSTTELLRWPIPAVPQQAGTPFLFRLSMAPVTEDGPFSDYSGYDRILLLLEGKGMKVALGDATTSMPMRTVLLQSRFDRVDFAGEIPVYGTLLDGAIRDFNLIFRRDRCAASLQITTEAGWQSVLLPAGCLHVCFFASGAAAEARSASGETSILPAGCLLHQEHPPAGTWQVLGADVICAIVSLPR